jgi:hypothetical protein
MSFGKMNLPVQLIAIEHGKDKDGFATATETILACVRAYKEDKNSTEKWANRAVLKDASALFRFRCIPSLTVTTDMMLDCCDGRYNITSVENVRRRSMYYEVIGRLEGTDDGDD